MTHVVHAYHSVNPKPRNSVSSFRGVFLNLVSKPDPAFKFAFDVNPTSYRYRFHSSLLLLPRNALRGRSIPRDTSQHEPLHYVVVRRRASMLVVYEEWWEPLPLNTLSEG